MIVRVDTDTTTIDIAGTTFRCAIGRGGSRRAADKREGDGCTPIGCWPMRTVLLRPDRGVAPPARLPWRWLHRADGWSDDSDDPDYNRPVCHPHRFSAERLWRDDSLYDAIVTLGHNDAPPVADRGSAIFLHITDGGATAGCVAVAPAVMRRLLAEAMPGDLVEIV